MEKKTRNRPYDYSLNCVHCGGTFQATRYDAKFCGVACRKAHSRKESEIRERADSIVTELVNFSGKYSGRASSLGTASMAIENRENGKRRVEMVAELVRIKAVLDVLIDTYDY